jgi:hypothetical protein
MIPDIIELQHELDQLREEKNENENHQSSYSNQIKARTAKNNNRTKDIDILLRTGSTPCQVSEILGVHPDIVKARVAELERDEEDKREFMQTGQSPESGGVFTIYQS